MTARIPGGASTARIPPPSALAEALATIAELEAELAASVSWTTLADVDFTAEANLDVKALGNGNFTVAGLPITNVTIANATALDIVNATGLVYSAGAVASGFRIRTGAIAGAPAGAVGKGYLWRARVWSSFSGQAGGEHAAIYWSNAALNTRAGFTRDATTFYSYPSAGNFGAIGDTSFMQFVGASGTTSLFSGASPAAAVPRGSASPGFDDTTCWAGEIPLFALDCPVGPFVWTITRIVIDYQDPAPAP